MKIIIDECLPKRMIQFFQDDDVWSVPQIGLNGYKDSALLNALDKKKIDIFVTIDGNIEYQQQFKNRTFGTIIIRSVSNRFADLQQFKNELCQKIATIKAGEIIHIPV